MLIVQCTSTPRQSFKYKNILSCKSSASRTLPAPRVPEIDLRAALIDVPYLSLSLQV